MFQIYDGSMEFTQWDQGQKVTCDRMDAGDKVVFINFSGATYVMEAYAEGGVIVADVPNKLLQYASPIVIDLQDQPCQYTRIGVNASEKPEDYEFVDNTWVEKEDRPASGGAGSNGGGGCFVVNLHFDEETYEPSIDKTVDEILTAVSIGQPVFLYNTYGRVLFPLVSTELAIIFALPNFFLTDGSPSNFTGWYVVSISREGVVTVNQV